MNSAEELRRTIKEEIVTFMEAPLDYPQGFKSWLISYLSASNLRLPRSSVNGLYTVADSVAGLGEPAHGRPCMLRVGADPYDWVQMTYDDIAGLWVSTQVWTTMQIEDASGIGTTYDDLDTVGTNWDQAPVVLTSPGAKVTAGLKPQVNVAGRLTAATGGTVYLRAALKQFDDGDAALSAEVAYGGEVSTNSTSAVYKASGWVDMTVSGLTGDYAYLMLQSKYVTTSLPTVTLSSVTFRWVAVPA